MSKDMSYYRHRRFVRAERKRRRRIMRSIIRSSRKGSVRYEDIRF